ncbi:MAG: aminomethyl-transferring glycine dehydrogenase subunit GcvPB [Bacillota bacterium]
MKKYDKLIFEYSKQGKKAFDLPKYDSDKKISDLIDKDLLNEKSPELPEVSEVDIVRHFTNLSNMNYGVDTGFYPLGSCTMKYNPKINEKLASLDNFLNIHPLQDEKTVQGSLEIMYNLQNMLAEIAGMDRVTLQPAAGAHGEYTGIRIIKAYHDSNNNTNKKKIIVPDSAHGTNPATAAMVGYETVEIKSNKDGSINLENLKKALDEDVAGLMLTNPSTLGLFETNIKEIADLVHSVDGLLYYDGANMNAILGKSRPGDMGFDVMHYNLHKTFSTPHGGGGPGSGPVGVKEFLKEFLPVPVVKKHENEYILDYNIPNTIGKIKGFYGNFGIMLRAYIYILTMGKDGLQNVSDLSVLHANYLMKKLKSHYKLPIDQVCKHEFVLGGLKDSDVKTLDVAKRILDYGYHPPTIYFPLIVKEALMIEPTETESKETLDEFANVMIKIAKEAKDDKDKLKNAPVNMPVRRVDEVYAAKNLNVSYDFEK